MGLSFAFIIREHSHPFLTYSHWDLQHFILLMSKLFGALVVAVRWPAGNEAIATELRVSCSLPIFTQKTRLTLEKVPLVINADDGT